MGTETTSIVVYGFALMSGCAHVSSVYVCVCVSGFPLASNYRFVSGKMYKKLIKCPKYPEIMLI